MKDQQLDMFGKQKFGTSWKSQKLIWEEAQAMHRQMWETRKRIRNRGRITPSTGYANGVLVNRDTGEVLAQFDTRSLWISRAKQNEMEHENRIVDEFDSRLS